MRDRSVAAGKVMQWAPPLVWMALIFFLSAQSTLPRVTPAAFEFQDVVGHLAVYAVLAVLWYRALAAAGVRRAFVWAFVVAVLYGISDEFHQSFVPGRTATFFDVVTDAVGAGAGLCVVARWRC